MKINLKLITFITLFLMLCAGFYLAFIIFENDKWKNNIYLEPVSGIAEPLNGAENK